MSPGNSPKRAVEAPANVGPGRLAPAPAAAESHAGAQAATSPAIHVVGLSKRFGDTVAVSSLTMTVRRGEVFGFLGPNGAGKTTVVKLLLGLATPTGGEALVLGAPVGDREARRRIGYLPELFRFQPLLSAREVLHLHCRLLGLPKASWPEQAARALDTVDLTRRGDDRVGTFSKGMQQRLGLGVALLGDPALVVLDEPTSALDPVGRHDVREIIRGLRARGCTVFLNTHLLEEAEQVCDHVAVIDRGRALAIGSLDELLAGRSTVRIRLDRTDDQGLAALARFGHCQRRGEWLVVEGIDPAQIPDLIGELVARGARVHAVIPEHQSLETRFLELLQER